MLRVVRSVLERHLIREAVPDPPPPERKKSLLFLHITFSLLFFVC